MISPGALRRSSASLRLPLKKVFFQKIKKCFFTADCKGLRICLRTRLEFLMNINFDCNGSTLYKGFVGCITFIEGDDEKERIKVVRKLWVKPAIRCAEVIIILLIC
jgi:hypothetical protein